MKNKIAFFLSYYSRIIVFITFAVYLTIYSLFLIDLSLYYTYLMILFSGIQLGYIVAASAYKYLKKNPKKNT